MTKNMLVLVLAAVGCGNVMNPSGGSDDAAEQPDGGMPEADAGEPQVDPKVLSIVPTQWKDERNDAIDFSTGEPVHTHQGAGVTITGGGACPAAYRYAYLMDRAPVFGRQLTQNAMAIEIAVPTIALDESASAYRVTTAAGSVVIPWTPIGPVPATGRVRVALHRDETPKLGTYAGELHFDVRVRDTAGTEQLATACWVHQPMAAPVYVEPPQSALGPGSLTARQLSTASHAIDVLTPTTSVAPEVYSARVTQQTAEPVTISFAPAPPSGTFTATLAHLYTPTGTASVPGNCDDFPDSCDQSPVPTLVPITASGPLTTGTWSWTMVDETSGEKLPCSTTACELPGRSPGAAPHPYRLTVSASELWNLWPHPTQFAVAELSIAGNTIVGALLTSNTVVRCTRLKTLNGITACIAAARYTELLGLDRATLAMPPLAVQVLTGTSSIPAAPVPYLPNGAVTAPPVNWNGGDGPL
jgi:hypothetical protein